jgi:hypothetical protein
MSLSRTEREKDVTEKSAAARWKEEYDKQGIYFCSYHEFV